MAEASLTSTPLPHLSSTPIPSDNPIFSDEPCLASSPPSSPPEFPWEQDSTTKYKTLSQPSPTIKSAFSVLGKRKALSSINDNVRSAKKPTPTATAAKDAKPLTQMQISLGQEVQKKCKTCGMEYIASSDEDRKLHDKYHKQHAEGYDVGKDFLSKGRPGSVFKTSKAGDEIAAVDGSDSPWRRKRARAALDVVQRELGAVDIPDEQLWKASAKHLPEDASLRRHTVYMYVRQNKCVGLLLAEHIAEAKKVLEPAKPKEKDDPAKGTMSALEKLRARRAAQSDEAVAKQPIQVSTKLSRAKLGISRIWTSPTHRGQGIAQCLLDRALEHHNERVSGQTGQRQDEDGEAQKESESSRITVSPVNHTEKITKDHVAFSQPTEAGARLARKWLGRNFGWLVYID